MSDHIHLIKNRKRYTFVLLAANKTKIRGFHNNVSLFPFTAKELLIDIQVRTIKESYPSADIFLATGFDSDSVISYVSKKHESVRIIENIDYRETTSLDTFRLAANIILPDTNVFAIHADRFFNRRAIFTDGKNSSRVYCHQQDQGSGEKIGLCYQDSALKNMSYGLPSTWSEIVYFSQQDYKRIRPLFNQLKGLSVYSMYEFINYSMSAVSYAVDHHNGIEIEEIGI